MIDIAVLRAMAAAGAPVEAILAAIEADQAKEIARVQARRLADAERQRRKRQADGVTMGHTESRGHCVTPLDGSDTSVSLSSTSESQKDNKKQEDKKDIPRGKHKLPDTWEPNAAHYAKAERQGWPPSAVVQKADDMRNWAKSKNVLRADWDATFHGFLRANERMNGHATNRPNHQFTETFASFALNNARAAGEASDY